MRWLLCGKRIKFNKPLFHTVFHFNIKIALALFPNIPSEQETENSQQSKDHANCSNVLLQDVPMLEG